MIGNQISLTHKFKLIAVIQLLAPHGADFVVNQSVALLDEGLGLTAGIADVCKLHSILQLDELGGDGHRNGIVFSLNSNFHKKLLFKLGVRN